MSTLEALAAQYEDVVGRWESCEDQEMRSKLEDEALELVGAIEDKVDALAATMVKLDRQAEACVEDAKLLKARAATLKSKRAWLAAVASTVLAARRAKKLMGARYTLTRVTSQPRIEVVSIDKVPPQYTSCAFTVHASGTVGRDLYAAVKELAEANMGAVGPLEFSASKTALKLAIESGEEMPHGSALLVHGGESVRAYISRAKVAKDETDE